MYYNGHIKLGKSIFMIPILFAAPNKNITTPLVFNTIKKGYIRPLSGIAYSSHANYRDSCIFACLIEPDNGSYGIITK